MIVHSDLLLKCLDMARMSDKMKKIQKFPGKNIHLPCVTQTKRFIIFEIIQNVVCAPHGLNFYCLNFLSIFMTFSFKVLWQIDLRLFLASIILHVLPNGKIGWVYTPPPHSQIVLVNSLYF